MPTRHKYFMVTTIPNSITRDTWDKILLATNRDPYYVRNNRCWLLNSSYVCIDYPLKRDSRIFKCYEIEICRRKFWLDPKMRILIPKSWAYVQKDEKAYLKRLEKL